MRVITRGGLNIEKVEVCLWEVLEGRFLECNCTLHHAQIYWLFNEMKIVYLLQILPQYMRSRTNLYEIQFRTTFIWRFFSDISEQNNDYSDTFDFRKGVSGGGHIFRFGGPWLRIRNIMYFYIYVYAWLSLATPQIYTGVSSSTPN